MRILHLTEGQIYVTLREEKRNGVSMRRRKRNEIYAAQLKMLVILIPVVAVLILMQSIFH